VTQYAEVNWGFKACDETEALKTGAHKLIERVYSGNVGSSGKRIVAWRKEETI
jgi:hypothetical protein